MIVSDAIKALPGLVPDRALLTPAGAIVTFEQFSRFVLARVSDELTTANCPYCGGPTGVVASGEKWKVLCRKCGTPGPEQPTAYLSKLAFNNPGCGL